MNDIWPLIVSKLDNATFENISRTRLWIDIVSAVRSDTFWFSRVEHLIRHSLPHSDFDLHDSETWKSTFYTLESALLDQCPFLNLAMADHTIDVILPARVLLCSGAFPANPLGMLATACHARKTGLVELFLRDERVNANPILITMLIRGIITLYTTEPSKCLKLLLPYATVSDINANLNSGLPFQSDTAVPFLEHPLCHPSERMLKFALMYSDFKALHLILQNRKFDMKASLRQLHFPSFLSMYRTSHADHIAGYEFGVTITKSRDIPNDSYDALLRVLIIQNRTTSECIEYMRGNHLHDGLISDFSALLEPDMTLAKLAEKCSNPLLIRAVCTHLGMRRLREEGADEFILRR